eukprot:13194937-Alexandrium_andersonii.AAC.1
MPEAEAAPMAVEQPGPEEQASEKLKEIELVTLKLEKLGVAPSAELKAMAKSLKAEEAAVKDPPR